MKVVSRTLAFFVTVYLVTGVVVSQKPKKVRQRSDLCQTSWGSNGTCRHFTMCHGTMDAESICYWYQGSPHICCDQSKLESRSLEVTPELRYPGCGSRALKKKKGESTRIVGGVPVGGYTDHEWPWMVQIYVKGSRSRVRFLCGGAIISRRYILTAAHCFDQDFASPSQYFVRIGSLMVGEGVEHRVAKIKVHENYTPGEFYDDIAVIKVKKEMHFNDRVAPVCLPSSHLYGDDMVDREVVVAGWGHTTFAGQPSRMLQEVGLPVVPNDKCQAAYARTVLPTISRGITDGMLCAGLDEGGKDSCQGDSGGPLLLKKNGEWMIVGIVSFGYRCAEPGYPGVYTRVPNYLHWLEENTDVGG